ncbi:hypothetical protein LEMLEM_LOCUS17148 [Lemmus lemmus]
MDRSLTSYILPGLHLTEISGTIYQHIWTKEETWKEDVPAGQRPPSLFGWVTRRGCKDRT